MKVLIDTSAYSALHRGEKAMLGVMQEAETVAIPAIVPGELHSGFRQENRYAENRALLAGFLAKPSVRVLSVTKETA
ncbi:MAG: PIN domain-containing protein [Bryobacterales bacterium]|nr:PIN domain-containing protein [Bryobacterales bacterium]